MLYVQVVDLHEVRPESALEFCKLLPNHRTRILVCGGDGSVGWVLGALDKVKLKVRKMVVPQVAQAIGDKRTLSRYKRYCVTKT